MRREHWMSQRVRKNQILLKGRMRVNRDRSLAFGIEMIHNIPPVKLFNPEQLLRVKLVEVVDKSIVTQELLKRFQLGRARAQ